MSINPPEHIHVSSICDLCGSDISQNVTLLAKENQELLGVKSSISTVMCPQCRFIFQPERFSDELLTALYEKDTSSFFGEAEDELPLIQSYLRERQAVISSALSTHEIPLGGAILDVGGGSGECCLHLVPRYRVVVADATDSLPADPRIEKVLGLFSPNLDEGSFDVVIMNHVLEHVFSPTSLLASANKMLKLEGILILEVPFELYTPLVARHLGDWRHVAYFCRTSLRQFLEKSGFAVDRLALEEGCYGVRRLPVLRAVAHKLTTPSPVSPPLQNSWAALATDMFAPTALMSLIRRIVVR